MWRGRFSADAGSKGGFNTKKNKFLNCFVSHCLFTYDLENCAMCMHFYSFLPLLWFLLFDSEHSGFGFFLHV